MWQVSLSRFGRDACFLTFMMDIKSSTWKLGYFVLIFLSAWSFTASCPAEESPACGNSPSQARKLSYEVIATYPHDKTAFTQGLVSHGGYLYESTGQLGASSLRKIDIETGEVVKLHNVNKNHFAEGVTVADGRLVQLTWKHGRAFIYDIESFLPSGGFEYEGEGWGIVAMGDEYLVSDGSADLKLLNHAGQPLGTIRAYDNGQPVEGLNEMEMVGSLLFANIWPTNCIAVINPSSWELQAWLNLSDLFPEGLERGTSTVLNGIAYSVESETLFVTGKYWPVVYELKITDVNKPLQLHAINAH
jgi:glutamine cyclotransferase